MAFIERNTITRERKKRPAKRKRKKKSESHKIVEKKSQTSKTIRENKIFLKNTLTFILNK